MSRLSHQAGHQCAVILESDHYKKYLHLDYVKVYELKTQRERALKIHWNPPSLLSNKLINPPSQSPVFLDFSSLAWQVPRDEYLSAKIVNSRFNQLCKYVDKFKPDYLIGDTYFLCRIVAKKYSIPLIQITRKAGYPLDPEFLWWRKSEPRWTAPDALAPFKFLLDQYNFNDIEKIEDLLKGDIYLIPAVQEIEPVKQNSEKVFYIGPLSDMDHRAKENKKKKSIYITIGGGSKRGRVFELIELIINAFKNSDIEILISSGGLFPAKNINQKYKNIRLEDWVDGKSEIQNHELTIFHGGYGTMMEVSIAGKKSVIIPSHTEQEGNGRRLEALGVGKVLLPFSKIDGKLQFEWPFGFYEMGAAFDYSINSESLFETCSAMLGKELANKEAALANKLKRAQNSFDINHLLKLV